MDIISTPTQNPEIPDARIGPSCCVKDLTDQEWARIGGLLSHFHARRDPRGRPHSNIRAVLNGVLWKVSHNNPWADLPTRYPVYQTCHRYYVKWYESGLFLKVLMLLYGPDGEDLCQFAETQMRKLRKNKARKASTA